MRRPGCLIAVAGFAFLLIVVIGAVATPILRHNGQLDDWRSMLEAVPLPDGAAVVETGSELGVIRGNGSHCDFLAWIILRTDDTRTTVEHCYAEQLDRVSEVGQLTAGVEGPGLIRVEWIDIRSADWDVRCQ